MTEHNFWRYIRSNLNITTYRVENKVMVGMPDVHYLHEGTSGWIELKFISDWPKKRMTTGLMLTQAMWLEEYSLNGGNSWIMFRIARDFAGLINGRDAMKVYERPSRSAFMGMLHWQASGNLQEEDWENLKRTLCNL
jgi:hypothetical protein